MAEQDKPHDTGRHQAPAHRAGHETHSPRRAGEPGVEARAGEHVSEFTADQLATPAPTLAGSRQMWIIAGPYKGTVLTMPDAEAENAKDDHWAIEMSDMAPPFDADKPLDHDHELTDEDRAHAVEAANAWAAKVNAPPEPPPPEGEAQRRRAMETGRQRGEYETRGSDERTRR
jgi:hypothetical protein